MWRLSLRDLQWRRRRFTIAVAATAPVFAMTLLFAGVNASFHNEVRRTVASVHADRWLVAEGASGPFTTASVIPAAAAEQVARLPGVRRADPLVIFHSAVRVGTLRDVNVIGYRLGGMGSPAVRDGRVPAGPGEVVVDTELGLGIGEQVTVSGRTLRVVGLAEGLPTTLGNQPCWFPSKTRRRSPSGASPWRWRSSPKASPPSSRPGCKRSLGSRSAPTWSAPLPAPPRLSPCWTGCCWWWRPASSARSST